MRLWSIHPRYLDSQGLVALWREALLARAVLRGQTRGYRHHPQLERFRAHASPRAAISVYLSAVLREANRRELHDKTQVIYLHSSAEEVFRRVRNNQNRPLLQVDDPLGRLRTLLAERDPLYRETAHFVIETGRPSVPTLVNMIVMQLELAGLLPPRP